MRSAFVIANEKNVRTVPMRILNGQPIVSKYVILYHMQSDGYYEKIMKNLKDFSSILGKYLL